MNGSLSVGPYVGLPYQARGRSLEGVDCYGLVRIVYAEELGLELPRYEDAPECRDATVTSYLMTEAARWIQVQPGEEGPGDIIVLHRYNRSGHVGVVVRPGEMLHVHEGGLSHLSRYEVDSLWRRCRKTFYRYPKVAQG